MSITKSAKKNLRKSLRKRQHNLFYKKKIKALIKKARGLFLEGKKEEAKNMLPEIYKVLDKATKENVLKKNTARRKKSKIAKLVK